MANRLADESSPYLLQHQDNPVHWQPWDAAALEQAEREDKPIFLSIGYAACHWCHVMEHESFENAEIAALLNREFVSIKVDREERPDLDQIYMNAVQAMTGHGGWPMSVFLTPDRQPFYGGTYWPPAPRGGMPGFPQVLNGVLDAWRNRREQAVQQAAQLTEYLQQLATQTGEPSALTPELLNTAGSGVVRGFDYDEGGFGHAPKFPHPLQVALLLRLGRRTGQPKWLAMARLTLDKMAHGGIYDHLGGGFHRYTVDGRWLVPHFEKMLYDNALLSAVYVEAFQATAAPLYAERARGVYDYVLREMTDPSGGFYSTQDADSEGVEGKFFVWTPQEIRDALGDEAAAAFCRVYDVTEQGNFEHKNILNLPKPLGACAALLEQDEAKLREELAASRAKLFALRERRIKPALDDKALASWNGLMIDSLARAAGPLAEPRYRAAAVAAAEFIWRELRDGDDRLLHVWRRGQAKLPAFLDDYAAVANAYVSVYEATFDEMWIERACLLADRLIDLFYDADDGAFYYTPRDGESLIARQQDMSDSAVPGGGALAAFALLRLAALTGRVHYRDLAVGALSTSAELMAQSPLAAGQLLLGLDFHLGPTPQLVLLGDLEEAATRETLAELHQRFLPNRTLALRAAEQAASREPSPLDPLFAGKTSGAESPALFVCEDFACQAPAYGSEAAKQALSRLAAG